MPVPPFTPILRPELAELVAYAPSPDRFPVRLDANEAPPLLSAEGRALIDRALASLDWCRYPDARMTELREAIAAHADATPEEVIAGCGSDEVIALLMTALGRSCDGAPEATVLVTTPTFVMYKLAARARGLRVVEVPLDAGWDLDVDAMTQAIGGSRPNVVFIATPNNPTGGMMSPDRLQAVIQSAPDSLVVIDEAYIDYAGAGARIQGELRRRHPNVAVLRTLSKVGFAALRVGWMIGPPALVREVDKIRAPYNMSTASQRVATSILRELGAEIDRLAGMVVAERERVAQALSALGLGVAPSAANFLWVETKRPGKEVFETLAARGVLVRSFHAAGGRLANRLRITVGLPAENDRLLEEIREISAK